MSRPTGRVLTLLELLQSGGIRTIAELADRLGVDGRTVRRYVGHLIDLDVPVESVRGRYGGFPPRPPGPEAAPPVSPAGGGGPGARPGAPGRGGGGGGAGPAPGGGG